MPITPTDLKEYRSINQNSDGGAISDQEVISGEDNNLFADIDTENAGTVYRKVFRKNTNPTQTWKDVRTWITSRPKNAFLSFGLSINHFDADNGSEEGNMAPLEENSVIAIVSDGDGDDRKVALIGEDADGNHQAEVLTLDGNKEIVSKRVFSKLYGAYVYRLSDSHSVTIKQGPNGVTRGTILPNTGSSFLWMDTDSESDAMKHGDIEPNESFGLWYRLTWPAGAGSIEANSTDVKSEGNTD